eukprot:gb/GECH01004343.1/.p1 GENE.gb/GECH01004343.1/~~gb/GECH01004343.1/.p1  ORF type:complete len:332 (+),score=49.72 gb/GECH01004343.1/:1-996(+)
MSSSSSSSLNKPFKLFFNQLKQSPISKPSVLRVNQLDAQRLDEEINSVLKHSFRKIFYYFDQSIIDRIQPELTAVLHTLIFYFSVFHQNQTYGDRLMNLKYRNEYAVSYNKTKASRIAANTSSVPSSEFHPSLTQKGIYALLLIGVPWLWSRIQRRSTVQEWGAYRRGTWQRQVWKGMQYLESLYKGFNVINFLVFLYDGKYRNIIDRIVKMRLVYDKPLMSRQINFEYMNRQLVWNGFAELLLFILPLINFSRIKHMVTKPLSRFRNNSTDIPQNSNPHACGLCGAFPIVVPVYGNCDHPFCYYCIESKKYLEGDPSCPKCDQPISNLKR